MLRINLVLEAMDNVKARARKALENKNPIEYNQLMGDLMALHVCLEDEAKQLIKELDESEAA